MNIEFENFYLSTLNLLEEGVEATLNMLTDDEKRSLEALKTIAEEDPQGFDFQYWKIWLARWMIYSRKGQPGILHGIPEGADPESADPQHTIRETLKSVDRLDDKNRYFSKKLLRYPGANRSFDGFYLAFSKTRHGEGASDSAQQQYDTNQIETQASSWKNDIRIVYSDNQYVIWGTKNFESTTYKFIATVWNTNNPSTGDYGNPNSGSPYCTKQKSHWLEYEEAGGGPEKYEQFWIFRNDNICGPGTVGTCMNGNVAVALERMRGKGPEDEFLIGNIDTAFDILDRYDRHDDSWMDDTLAKALRTILGIDENPNSRFIIRPTADGGRELVKYITGKLFGDTDKNIIRIPDGVTIIGKSAFARIFSDAAVIIPGSVWRIMKDAFSRAGIKNVKFLHGDGEWVGVDNQAFYNCNNLETLELNGDAVTLTEGAMRNCRKLKRVSGNTKKIAFDTRCFSGCLELREIILPNAEIVSLDVNDVDSFGDDAGWVGVMAFANCRKLERIITRSKIGVITVEAFRNCENLSLDLSECRQFERGSLYGTDLRKISLPANIDEKDLLLATGLDKDEYIAAKEGRISVGYPSIGTNVITSVLSRCDVYVGDVQVSQKDFNYGIFGKELKDDILSAIAKNGNKIRCHTVRGKVYADLYESEDQNTDEYEPMDPNDPDYDPAFEAKVKAAHDAAIRERGIPGQRMKEWINDLVIKGESTIKFMLPNQPKSANKRVITPDMLPKYAKVVSSWDCTMDFRVDPNASPDMLEHLKRLENIEEIWGEELIVSTATLQYLKNIKEHDGLYNLQTVELIDEKTGNKRTFDSPDEFFDEFIRPLKNAADRGSTSLESLCLDVHFML